MPSKENNNDDSSSGSDSDGSSSSSSSSSSSCSSSNSKSGYSSSNKSDSNVNTEAHSPDSEFSSRQTGPHRWSKLEEEKIAEEKVRLEFLAKASRPRSRLQDLEERIRSRPLSVANSDVPWAKPTAFLKRANTSDPNAPGDAQSPDSSPSKTNTTTTTSASTFINDQSSLDFPCVDSFPKTSSETLLSQHFHPLHPSLPNDPI